MNIPNEGQIEFISNGLLKNVRQDGRTNNQKRLVHLRKGILLNCLGSCYLEDGDNKIYAGIKMEVVSSSEKGIISVSIDSMKRRAISRDHQNIDKDKLTYIESFMKEFYLNYVDKSSLVLIEGKKCWAINIDLFVLNYIDESQLENILRCLHHSLLDLLIPQLKITHNYLTNEDIFEVVPDKFDSIKFDIPEFLVVGQVAKQFVFDMTVEEFYSVEQKYVVVQKNKKVLLVRKFESNESGILPEEIMNLYMSVSNQS